MHDDYFRDMHIPSEVGNAFLDTFTRMEYALKSSGDFADGDATAIVASWDRFANHIDAALQATKDNELRAALTFLLAEPARKQNIGGFNPLVLDPKQTKTLRTLLVVRTVRNNIVHGGKIAPEGENEKGRNEKLVASSLLVLRYAAEMHDKVKAKFEAVSK